VILLNKKVPVCVSNISTEPAWLKLIFTKFWYAVPVRTVAKSTARFTQLFLSLLSVK